MFILISGILSLVGEQNVILNEVCNIISGFLEKPDHIYTKIIFFMMKSMNLNMFSLT